MDPYFIYELIGYFASVLVAVSLMMSKIVRLRIINTLGAITFMIYGILIDSMPVAGVNAFIVAVNVYYLIKIYTAKEYFKLLQVSSDDDYLSQFLDFYRDGIADFQPGFTYNPDDDDLILMVLRDMIPAGILVGKKDQDDSHILNVELDFVIPQYRDFKIGKFLYHDKRNFFSGLGIKTIRAKPEKDKHRKYLEQMSFQKDDEDGMVYRLDLEPV
jgi:hypothetical protein